MTAAPLHKVPHVLVILDGVGHREETKDNAYLAANTPNLDAIYAAHPHGLISASGEDVGLPDGQFGNSEVGHMNLGAGRVLYQDSTKISKEIREGQFFENAVLLSAIEKARASGGSLHLLGLLSDGGVHAHIDHIVAMSQLAARHGVNVFLHAFLDGRDTPPKSAEKYIADFEAKVVADNAKNTAQIKIVSLIGRYFAMDRDERWDRVEQAYRLLTEGVAVRQVANAQQGLAQAYADHETDEFVKATTVGEPVCIADGDSVVFMNFRADRAREITRAFVDVDFVGFERNQCPKLASFVMLTRYAKTIAADIAYMPADLKNSLGEYLADLGKTQLRIAETEKYAHVTFFFSGGREEPFDGEQRILIKSPNVATYDLKPEMSAFEVTDALVEAIHSGTFDALIVNYANGDMVGHTGIFDAAVKAIEALDGCMGRVYEAVMLEGGHMLVTADHGNVEQMMDYHSGQIHTQHTTEFVPLVYVGPTSATIASGGILADIAPTLLHLMQLTPPSDMTGRNLVTLGSDRLQAASITSAITASATSLNTPTSTTPTQA